MTNYVVPPCSLNRVVGLDLTDSLLHFANDNDFSAKESQIVDTRFPRVGHLRCLLSEEDTLLRRRVVLIQISLNRNQLTLHI